MSMECESQLPIPSLHETNYSGNEGLSTGEAIS